MKLNLGGARSHETGYGRMTHELIRAFEAEGVQVDDYVPQDHHADGTPAWGTTDLPIHRNGLWITAPAHVRGWWAGQRVHVFTMWEATTCPPGFRENVHEIETLIVPSQQNVNLFSRWHDNVRKVPLGIDPTAWHYTERPPVEREFRFMCQGQGRRKGIDIVVKAFNHVFGGFTPTASDPIPKLIVKDRTAQEGVRGERIQQMSGTITRADEIELYAQAHCFIGMARGEGWGMMPFQAMAQGCPTILSDAHGHHEFAHLAAAPIGTTPTPADSFIFGQSGDWWEPDFDELCAAMWDIYVNYEDYLPIGKHAAEVIADEYTWGHSARKIIDIIGPESMKHPDLVAPRWYESTAQLFWIVPSEDCTYEINGAVFKFQKGEDYHELGDIKRMMFDHGKLDPVCLADPHESGLLPSQLSELERYKAQKARCPTCHQRLNSDTSLDFDDDDALELTP